MKENEISQLKLKIIDICEDLCVSFETIHGLSNVLAQYSLDYIHENESDVLALISVLNEKISEYREYYNKFEDLLFIENF